MATFRVSPLVAPDIVGAMLTRWHYIALGAPLLLLVMEFKRLRSAVIVVVFIAILFAAVEGFLDIRIHALRMSGDRRLFGMLHGISQMLLIGQVIAAAIAVGAIEKEGSAAAMPPL
ncbi:MAG TPA: hypothetical protein VJ901_18355 [Thermoanaerobaculia bacterium]|nr:hypothetical protein [Thermoanaerobaculia bacterium]